MRNEKRRCRNEDREAFVPVTVNLNMDLQPLLREMQQRIVLHGGMWTVTSGGAHVGTLTMSPRRPGVDYSIERPRLGFAQLKPDLR